MRTIAIMNNKGGTGKTVTAINLADILVRDYGKRVLLLDCDGQMNLSRFCVPDLDPEDCVTVADLLTGDHEPYWPDNLTPVSNGLDLLPGSPGLYDLDLRAIRDGVGDTCHISGFLDAVAEDGEVDYCIIDCPPGYTLASVSALLAADDVVAPMLLDGFSFSGAMDLETQLNSLQHVKHGSRLAGILINQWHRAAVVQQGEELLRELPFPVFRTVIRRTDKLPESTFERQPIVRYSPGSAAARDFRKWVREYLGDELGVSRTIWKGEEPHVKSV